MKPKTQTTPTLPDEWDVYAYLDNGRELREADVDGAKWYFFQPADDNYWLARRTPLAALRAYNQTKRPYDYKVRGK